MLYDLRRLNADVGCEGELEEKDTEVPVENTNYYIQKETEVLVLPRRGQRPRLPSTQLAGFELNG